MKFIMKKKVKDKMCSTGSCSTESCLYMVGFVGAAVYYIGTASGFWAGVLGFIKALVWPAFLVYGVLKYLGM